jgi:hypothetical protein
LIEFEQLEDERMSVLMEGRETFDYLLNDRLVAHEPYNHGRVADKDVNPP